MGEGVCRDSEDCKVDLATLSLSTGDPEGPANEN